MDISCVALSWNSERFIAKCLNALIFDLEQHNLKYEIFVVDNGSHDLTVSILKSMQMQYPERIFPIYLGYNKGTTYSRNLALKRAKGRYICVLDCDLEVSPGAVVQLIHTLEKDPRIGLVAPKLLYPNGNLQKSTDVFPTILTKAIRYFFLKFIEKHNHERAKKLSGRKTDLSEVDYAISAMWIFKRVILDKVGFLDENIFYSPEDADYCLRIWRAGWMVVYDPAVTCVHHAQEISRRRINRAMIQHIIGLFYYFRKHRYLSLRPKRHL
jgi:GT2 family glycosyltransferase